MNDHFGVGGRLKDRTGLLELVAQQRAVDEIAVVRDRDRSLGIFDDERLGVFEMALALSGVAVVADGVGAFEPLDDFFFEGVGDQPHLAMGDQPLAVGSNDAARFLAAMLQRIEAQVNHVGRLGMAIDAHHRALVVEFVEFVGHRQFSRSRAIRLTLERLNSCTKLFEPRRQTIRPDRTQFFHWQLQQRLKHQPAAADGADRLHRHMMLVGELLQPLQIVFFDRNDNARLRLAEQATRRRESFHGSRSARPDGLSGPPMQHSANATAKPPSETSWADCSSPCSIASRQQLCTASSSLRSIHGGVPRVKP